MSNKLCFGCEKMDKIDKGFSGYALICTKFFNGVRGSWNSQEFGIKVPHAKNETCYTPRQTNSKL